MLLLPKVFHYKYTRWNMISHSLEGQMYIVIDRNTRISGTSISIVRWNVHALDTFYVIKRRCNTLFNMNTIGVNRGKNGILS